MSAPQVRINGAQMCPECASHVDFAIHGFQAEIDRLTAERDDLAHEIDCNTAEFERAGFERDAARAELAALRERVLPILEYVSRGRRFVDVEPYPDAEARAVLGEVLDARAAAGYTLAGPGDTVVRVAEPDRISADGRQAGFSPAPDRMIYTGEPVPAFLPGETWAEVESWALAMLAAARWRATSPAEPEHPAGA